MTIRSSLWLAGLLLTLALSLVFAVRFDVIDTATQQRMMGVAAGLVLVIFSNAAPKTLKPLSEQRCEASKVQAVERFSAWALVLAGLGYSLTWLVAPVESASAISMAIVATGVGLVLARIAWLMISRRNAQPSDKL